MNRAWRWRGFDQADIVWFRDAAANKSIAPRCWIAVDRLLGRTLGTAEKMSVQIEGGAYLWSATVAPEGASMVSLGSYTDEDRAKLAIELWWRDYRGYVMEQAEAPVSGQQTGETLTPA